ncbi:MAG: DNA polymerase IV [Deltaproteobacteria bacterium]|nr:DNA polymerase IV [Deltaproteobacteria bacterium]
MSRSVLFAEVPSFYASVESARDPELAERPVIVGGDPRKRGLVQAASAEALTAGVEPEMPMVEALRLCPRARLVRTNMALYRETSRRLFACLRQAFPRLEPFGLGAAYFDVSGAAEGPEEIAADLQQQVAEQLALPLRVGIASSKLLARLVAEEAGGSGLRRIPPGKEQAFLRPLAATRIEGVGRKTAATLAELGAETIGDVVELGSKRLEAAFGMHGQRIFALASGVDDSPVRAVRHAQSLSREVTIGGEARDRGVLAECLQDLARQLEAELVRQALSAGRVALKVRYADHGTHTRSQALGSPIARATDIQALALRLLDRTQAGSRPVRGCSLQLSRLTPAAEVDRQLELFP